MEKQGIHMIVYKSNKNIYSVIRVVYKNNMT